MKPRFKDDFEKNEWLGRQALLELKSIYPEIFKSQIHFTVGKYDNYDAYYMIYDETGQFIKKRVWIEIKIRSEVYDNYILEKSKVDKLKSDMNNLYLTTSDITFIYLCFTPEGSLLWNINEYILGMHKTGELNCNKSTSISRTNKVDKDIYYLETSNAKKLNYLLNENSLLRKWDEMYLLPLIKDKVKKVSGLEDILFG